MAGKTIAAFLAFVVVVGVVMCVGVFGFGWFARSTADFRGRTAQIERVQGNGNYRIAAYDHFFDLCAQVQTTEASITNLRTERTSAGDVRAAQIDANITALSNARAGLINQYNADASKTDTQAHFLASDLPYRLDINAKETTCAAH